MYGQRLKTRHSPGASTSATVKDIQAAEPIIRRAGFLRCAHEELDNGIIPCVLGVPIELIVMNGELRDVIRA